MDFTDQLLQYIITGITNGSIYALLAVGFVAIHQVTGVINFAQGESAMLGALLLVSLHNQLGLPLVMALLLTVSVVSLIGLALYQLAVRPVINAPSHRQDQGRPLTAIIITIGASIAIRGTALMIWGTDSYMLPAFGKGRPVGIGSAVIQSQSFWVFGALALALVVLYLFFHLTMLGKALRACAVNRLAARLMGINHNRMAGLSFALGGALGAIAGAVIAPMTYATYDMGAMLGLKGFVAAIMGGLASLPGAVAGGLLLGILEATGAGLIYSGAKDAIAFAVLLIVLFFRPGELFRARLGNWNRRLERRNG